MDFQHQRVIQRVRENDGPERPLGLECFVPTILPMNLLKLLVFIGHRSKNGGYSGGIVVRILHHVYQVHDRAKGAG